MCEPADTMRLAAEKVIYALIPSLTQEQRDDLRDVLCTPAVTAAETGIRAEANLSPAGARARANSPW